VKPALLTGGPERTRDDAPLPPIAERARPAGGERERAGLRTWLANAGRTLGSRPTLAICGLFVLSVLVRLPSFGIDPVDDAVWTSFQRWNNTEVWRHTWYVLDVYSSHSAWDHKFASYIPGSWPAPEGRTSAEEFLSNAADPDLTVYTSFPAVHFVVLYLVLTVFGGEYTYEASQVFGLALHALCVGLVAYLAHLLTRRAALTVAAAAIYTLSTGTLWYHMNVYWTHELLMPVFLGAVIVFVRRRGSLRPWQAVAFAFAMSLVTWTGAVAAVGFALHSAYRWWRSRDRADLGGAFAVVGMVLALALNVVHVLLATGTTPLEYAGRLLERAEFRAAGGSAANVSFPVMSWFFVNNLLIDYGAFFVIAFALALRHTLNRFQWELAFVSAFPLLESFLILEHDTTYGFARLKWLVPVILVICMAAARLRRRRLVQLGVAVGAACALHVALYLVVFQTVP
jgi:hypothetical protein